MSKKDSNGFPTRAKLIEATYDAIVSCNGSATNDEIQEQVIHSLNLPDDIINIMHADNVQTRLQYELRWARTFLKKYGAIKNSSRGIWARESNLKKDKIDGNIVCQKVREMDASLKKENIVVPVAKQDEGSVPSTETEEEPWRTEISKILHEMDPFAFERLTMRLLRECGFSKVTVTKKSGDNGVDGFGKIILNGLVSVNVAFQCKRYTGPVSSSAIRDFRGSLSSGIEKGLFITTGSFSNAAIKEAGDFGKTPNIDLIDGEALINLLFEHELGVSKEVRTVYCIHKSFFDKI